jgi:hypothetical protein
MSQYSQWDLGACGCPTPTPDCHVKICVAFCGVRANVADVDITVAGNTFQTDSTGCAIVTVPGAGTYEVTATPPDTIHHYKETTTSITVTSAQCTNPTIPTFNINIEPDDAYVCPLVGNDGLGAIPLTWDGSAWVGTATRTWHNAIIYVEPNLFCITDHLEDVSVSICVTFQCLVDGGMGMTISVPVSGICTATNPLPIRACNVPGWGLATFFHAGTNGGGTVSSCDPFNWSSPPATPDGTPIYGAGPITLSVTE